MDAHERIEEVLERHALYLDVLVNNAGIALSGPFSVRPRADRPARRDQYRGGHVTYTDGTSRNAGPLPRRDTKPVFAGRLYARSVECSLFRKQGLCSLVDRSISAERAGEGVRICTVTFGPVRTQMLDELGGGRTHYKTLFASSSPDRMARLAWRSYRLGRRVVVPGFTTTVLGWWVRAMPYELLLRIVSWLMRPRLK